MIRKLTDTDLSNLIGTTQKGYYIEDARIKNGPFSDSDHYGYVVSCLADLLGENEDFDGLINELEDYRCFEGSLA